jgi:hypothetical protein
MCVQCGIYRISAIWDNRVQLRYVGHMRVRWDSRIGIRTCGCNVRKPYAYRVCHSCVGNL